MNYGVAVPFSTDGPSMLETQQSDAMEDYLFSCGAIYETPAGERMRVAVIEKLRAIVQDWATELGKEKAVPPEYLASGGGIQLRIFGSTRLGVHNSDSDIDILCLAPSFVTRNDFFTSFRDLVASRGDIESLLSVPEAYTPVIKFILDGQAVDMVFAALKLPVLTNALDILDVRCLNGLDDASVRSINGSRVAEWICRLVPDTENFCSTLRVIKYWARQRGVYSNMLGFLGGINYAILVALICQLYVRACPSTLVQKFFEVYCMWQWPNPVMLRAFEDLQMTDLEGRPLPVWNAMANFKDSTHIMPIITPAYPAMNSAYNVSPPQFRAFQDEVTRAFKIFQMHGHSRNFPWHELFKSCTGEFFQRNPRFVQVDVIAASADDHRAWFGWVESRLRMLIIALEQPPVTFCHPVANCFHRCLESTLLAPAVSGLRENKHTSAISREQETPASVEGGSQSTGSETTREDGHNSSSSTNAAPRAATPESEGRTAGAARNDAPPAAAPTREHTYISSFMIGISFKKGSKVADLQPAIQEFEYKVNTWASKTDSMTLKMTIFDSKNVPDFVFRTPAQPSDVKSCTPQPARTPSQHHDVTSVSARLFPTSATKAPLPREASETGLSTVLSNSSIDAGESHRCNSSPRSDNTVMNAMFPEGGSPRVAPYRGTPPLVPTTGLRSPANTLPLPLAPAPVPYAVGYGASHPPHSQYPNNFSPRGGGAQQPSFSMFPTGGYEAQGRGGSQDGGSPASVEYYSPNGQPPQVMQQPAQPARQYYDIDSSGAPQDHGLYAPADFAPAGYTRTMPFPHIQGPVDAAHVGAPRHLVQQPYPDYGSAPSYRNNHHQHHQHQQHHQQHPPHHHHAQHGNAPPPFAVHSSPKRNRKEHSTSSERSLSSGSGSGAEGSGGRRQVERRPKFDT